MSLGDVSAASGLPKGHLSSIEHGLSAITIETMERIASAFKIPAMYIMANPSEDDRARTAELLLELPPRELAQVRRDVQARVKASQAAEASPSKRQKRATAQT